MGLRADYRSAAVVFVTDYVANASLRMQIYPARPRSISPPTAFVDIVGTSLDHETAITRIEPVVEVVVIHGILDSKEAADQADAFADGLTDWAEDRFHGAGANRLIALARTEDLPNYVPEWMPPDQRLVYYATRITFEGYARS